MEGNINLYTFVIVKPLSEKKQYKHILMIHLYIICKLSCTGNYSSDIFRMIDGTIRFNNAKIQTHALG